MKRIVIAIAFVGCLLLPLLDAARRAASAEPVAPSMPHPYGYDWDVGITDDPYLFGPLVLLTWDYSGDESTFIPYPGYQVYRRINNGTFVRIAGGLGELDQREYVDDLSGIPNYSEVSYFIVTKATEPASPVLTFLYLEDWPP